jgi:hypothetical protein
MRVSRVARSVMEAMDQRGSSAMTPATSSARSPVFMGGAMRSPQVRGGGGGAAPDASSSEAAAGGFWPMSG